MGQKIRVAVIFGGTNTEHEVSIVSARSVMSHLDPAKYEVIPVKITKDNLWLTDRSLSPGQPLSLTSSTAKSLTTSGNQLPPLEKISPDPIDVVFPVIHGPYGEDGTIQGMLEMSRLPYVGCGVLASAVCMDKVIQKQIVTSIGIPVAKFTAISKHDWQQDQQASLDQIMNQLEFPIFAKPANQGSSVGVTKATNQASLIEAVDSALAYDRKVIIEQGIANAREIECSVLGNDNPQASALGEIVPSNEFYDYNAKYIDGQSQAVIPAKLDQKVAAQIQSTAIQAFKILNCTGLARVDFLLDAKTNQHYLNELNTMPGFTSISMYPKLWEASGISYSQLLDKLIELALENHDQKSQIQYSYQPKTNWHEK